GESRRDVLGGGKHRGLRFPWCIDAQPTCSIQSPVDALKCCKYKDLNMATIFSGIQPSGELHLGNYLGAVHNWVRLQNDVQEQYRTLICVVDYHAITQTYEPKELAQRTLEMATDLVACGIDPER